jgi:ABC-2 type transport system ATP-binding protein
VEALSVRGLTKSFRGHVAVDAVDLTVAPGEVVALLGPNGAGKSTTLRICAGAASPDRGEVRVFGSLVGTDALDARRQVGYVPDVGGLFPRLTGWEHLELAARVHGLPPAWVMRGRELVDLLGLTPSAGRRASTYSHGMSRKLSLAVALLPSPGLLLLDEPFDGVDPAGTRAVRELVAEFAARGTGILVSTHLLDTAERISDRLVLIRAGRVLASGDAGELRARAGEAGPLEDAYLALMAEAGSPLASSG